MLSLGSIHCAMGQDVEALLTQVSLRREGAVEDVRNVGSMILPKLLDYAQNKKQDAFMSYMAKYALRRVVERPDVTFLKEALKDPARLEYAVRSFELLGPNAISARDDIATYIQDGADAALRERLASVLGAFGVGAVFELYQRGGGQFSPVVQVSARGVLDGASFEQLARSLSGAGPFSREWASVTMREIVDEICKPQFPTTDFEPPPSRGPSIGFSPLVLPRMGFASERDAAIMALFKPLFTQCLSTHDCQYQRLAGSALARLGDKWQVTLDVWKRLLNNPEPDIKFVAAETLVNSGHKADAPGELKGVLEKALTSESVTTRRSAAKALASTFSKSELLPQALSDVDRETRWQAAQAFVYGRDPQPALNVFVEMLGDDKEYFTGAEGLAAIGERAIPQIKNALHADSTTVIHALFALDLMRNKADLRAVVPDVLLLLDGPETKTQEEAASTIGELDARAIVDRSADIESHLSLVRSTAARHSLETALKNIHRLTLSPEETIADLVASGDQRGVDAVMALAAKRPLNQGDLLMLERALLSDADRKILWSWIEPAQKALIDLFIAQMKSEVDTTADRITTLFLRVDRKDATKAIRQLLDADPASDRPLRWLMSALPQDERYDEDQSKSKDLHSISSALMNRLLTSRPTQSAGIVEDILAISDFATESWMVCRDNYREAWKDSEPARTLSESDAARAAVKKLFSTTESDHVRHETAMLLVLSGQSPTSVAEALRGALDDVKPHVAEFAAAMLLRLNPGDTRAALRLLEHDSRENFDCTSQILQTLRDPAAKVAATHALETVSRDSRPAVRFYAATAALALNPRSSISRDVLVSIVKSGDDHWRLDAVRALVEAHVAGTESTEILIRSLNGGSPADQQWAVQGLQIVGEPAYLPLLRTASSSPKTALSAAAAKALGQVFGTRHIADFESWLHNNETVWIGLTALGATGPKARAARESVAHIVASDPPMAQSAARVLFQIDPTDPRAVPLMCSRAIDDDEFEAQDALSTLGANLLPVLTHLVMQHHMPLEQAAHCYGAVVSLLNVVAKKRAATLKNAQPTGELANQILSLSAAQSIESPEDLASFFERASSSPDPTVRDSVVPAIYSLRKTVLAKQPDELGLGGERSQPGNRRRALPASMGPLERVQRQLIQRINSEPTAFVRADLLLLPSRLPNPRAELWAAVQGRLSSDLSSSVRQRAAVALASAGPKSDTTDALFKAAFDDTDASVRRTAVDILSQRSLSPSQRTLLARRVMAEPNQFVVEGLLHVVANDNVPEDVVSAIDGLFKATSDDGVRRAAARVLGRTQAGTNALLLIAENQTTPSNRRYAAIEGLAPSGTNPLSTGIERLLNSEDSYVRYLTLRTLGRSGPNAFQISDAIASVVTTSAPREQVAAIETLGKVVWLTDVGRAALAKAAQSSDEFVREAAATAIGNLGSQAAPLSSELVTLLHDASPRVRSASAYALREMSPKVPAAVEPLTELIDDADIDVRRNAISALGSYGRLADSAVSKLASLMNDSETGAWADCAINRIRNGNLPNMYGSMEYRSAIPALPNWPPPRPSTQQPLDDSYFMSGATLLDAYDRLRSALSDRHYDTDVIGVDGGFALASRIERYDPVTGLSLPEPLRWSDQPSSPGFDLATAKRFFTGEDLHFRMFLFVITDRDFNAPRLPGLERQTLERWVYARAGVFPSGLDRVNITGHHCLLFVYSFSGKQQQQFILDTNALPAQVQLQEAGISKFSAAYARR